MVWMLLYLPRERYSVLYLMFGCVLLSNPLFVHCYAHSFNLAVQDTTKKFTLDITNEIPKVVKGNPKREAWLLLKKYRDFLH